MPIGKMGARVYIIGQYCVQGHNRAIYGKLTPLTGCLQACIIGAAVKILFSENTKYPSNHLGKRISPVECNSDYTFLRLISRNYLIRLQTHFFELNIGKGGRPDGGHMVEAENRSEARVPAPICLAGTACCRGSIHHYLYCIICSPLYRNGR
ncbi:protein of unknown function [Paenibacillus alvei]|uniref:Uncharacterized protein n=1 Tax=Paenibacillus alvei TaxID=44250 RepID=A0A383RJC6_PAEAL|nr:protein of unknown function [Paenibacillus alvei]